MSHVSTLSEKNNRQRQYLGNPFRYNLIQVSKNIPQHDGADSEFEIGKPGRTPLQTEGAVQQFYVELLKKSHFFWPSFLGTAIFVCIYYKGEDKHSEPSDADSSPIFLT